MPKLKADLQKLHQLLHPILVEVETAIDTETYPDWSVVKTNMLEALEIVRRLERDQVWRSFKK